MIPSFATRKGRTVWAHWSLEEARKHALELGGREFAHEHFLGFIEDWDAYRKQHPDYTIHQPD